MLKELTKMANHLDGLGLIKEADYLDVLIAKTAADEAKQSTISELRDLLMTLMFTKSYLRALRRDFLLPREIQDLEKETFEELISDLPEGIRLPKKFSLR